MKVLRFLWMHRTKTLGFAQVTLGVLASADGMFSPFGLKVVLLSSAISTAWLGFFNSAQIRKAEVPPE